MANGPKQIELYKSRLFDFTFSPQKTLEINFHFRRFIMRVVFQTSKMPWYFSRSNIFLGKVLNILLKLNIIRITLAGWSQETLYKKGRSPSSKTFTSTFCLTDSGLPMWLTVKFSWETCFLAFEYHTFYKTSFVPVGIERRGKDLPLLFQVSCSHSKHFLMHLLSEIFTFSRRAGKCFYPNFTDERLETQG